MTATPSILDHETLKYSLLGPSLTKSGQDSVDQQKVSEIIYNASKGSKYFSNEENRDKNLTEKIDKILKKKTQLEQLDLKYDMRKADEYIAELELSRDSSQIIVHVDCDAFYAACEELDRPELKDLPFSVGKGVLTVPLNFEKYTAKAQEVREILVDYDPRFESASIDEAYLNITSYCKTHNMDPEDVVQQLRQEVQEKTKITISAGIAANAKLAKICSNINKPNGQFRLASDRVTILAFMRDLPTRKVNGIGRVFERELDAVGIKTCGDIYPYRQYLSKLFGEKAFQFLIQCYLGLGRTKVQPAEEYERKSVGTESTFHDMADPLEFREKLRWTAEELGKDMSRTGFKGRTLVLKVKLHSYEVLSRQVIPPKAVFLADDLYRYSLPMLTKLEQEIPGLKLRLMGLRCTHLVSTKKPDALTFLGFKRKPSNQARDSQEGADDVASKSREGVSKRKAAELEGNGEVEQWESWPEEEFEDAARQERQAEMDEIEHLSQQEDINNPPAETEPYDPRRLHGKLILPNPTPKEKQIAKEEEEDWWECPICQRPQAAIEKDFNEHIDACLSRQTIREAVQEAEGVKGGNSTASGMGREGLKKGQATKKVKVADKKKDGDPKQRRLFFG